MNPTVDQVKIALGVDDDFFDARIADLIDQVTAEMLAKLDRNVYATAEELAAAADPAGIVATKDLINAQILLIGAYLDDSGNQDGERKIATAERILGRYRRMGA